MTKIAAWRKGKSILVNFHYSTLFITFTRLTINKYKNALGVIWFTL